MLPNGNMAHDCWFCRLNRVAIIAGFLAMAIVSFIGSTGNLLIGQWTQAGKEFLGSIFCLGMIWVGLTALKLWTRLMDRILPDGE